ncbi:MAG: hypothetical protein V3T17_17260, partial [Pseudomonadales bacterium]
FAGTSTHSAADATLDTGGWLDLSRQGLAPCKMHQASLGALTPCSPAIQSGTCFASFAKQVPL